VFRPSPQPPPRRMLVAELDSLEQATRYADSHGRVHTAERDLTGMIRTAVLLSETLLVTDSMLFDGAYFMAVGPEGLMHRLGLPGQRLPLVVLSSHRTLRESLTAKLNNHEFIWQLRDRNPLGLSETRAQEELEAHWLDWIRASERGEFDVELYAERDGIPKPPFSLALDHDRLQNRALPASAQALASAATEHGWVRRSDFHKAHRVAVVAAPAEEHESLDRVLQWWNDSYLDAVADQHDADWVRFDAAASDEQEPSAVAPHRRERLRLSGSIIENMIEAPAPVFGTLLYTLRKQRATFRDDPTERTLHAIAYGVSTATVQPGRFAVMRGARARFGFAVAALIASAPFTPTRVGDFDTSWIVLGILVVATVPWSELITMKYTSVRSLRGVVSVSRSREPAARSTRAR